MAIETLVKYLPITYSVGDEPKSSLQCKVLEGLQEQLQKDQFGGQRLALPGKSTSVDQVPRMITVFGNGKLESRTNSLTIFRQLPAPTLFFLINTVDKLPEKVNRFMARCQAVNAPAHCGAIFEGIRNPERALWISTQGNCQITKGSPTELYAEITRRIQVHYGSPFVSKRYEGGISIPWDEWANSPVHESIAKAASCLGKAGIIEDDLDINQYTTDGGLARTIAAIWGKNGIGESMRSEQDPHGYIGVTRSGGGKVNVDPDPQKGHIIPVVAIAEDGYVIPDIPDKPSSLTYSKSSVESFENGVIRLANSEAIGGKTRGFEEFLNGLWDRLKTHEFVPIAPEGLPISSIGSIDHGHWGIRNILDKNIKIGYPDRRYFPKIDYACGTLHAAMAFLSGLMLFDEFYQPNGFNKTTIIILLDGHGYGAVGKHRQVVTQALVHGVELGEPICV